MNDKFRSLTGGMSMWVLVAAAVVVLALYVLQGVFNDWVFFIALAVVVISAVAILKTRKNRMAGADRQD
ncbi:MAG TPA: hypothetical protein K8V11_00495 [Dietzia timorensis]|uniref:Uncharacterized protein n=1 Tax=Dietzia timorensis TaxID=499555 RepID=A0A921F296_9ACTN|nr:hypothetical protein [Dietzia timorensis]HJE89473.1 hypothetical protein [Dietzia timorensis]